MTVPAAEELDADLADVAASHSTLSRVLDHLSDGTARQPSRLPGWSVGHVLSHLARNADSFVRVLHDAAEGRVGVQYPGGPASRDADIEAGSGRSAAELRADVAATNAALETAFAATAPATWATGSALRGGSATPLVLVPLRRLQEVQIHLVDLDLGYEPASWPDRFVARELSLLLPDLAARLPAGVAVELAIDGGPPSLYGTGSPVPVARTAREVLCWLAGRTEDPGLPRLGPW